MDGYAQIGVTAEAFDVLRLRKIKQQAKLGRDVTWSEFLLEATE